MTGKYDELVAGIRHCFSTDATCRSCPLDKCPGEGVWEWAMIALTKQAADALEELSELADAIPHVCECCVGCELENENWSCDNGFILSPKRAMQYLIKPRWISVKDTEPPQGET